MLKHSKGCPKRVIDNIGPLPELMMRPGGCQLGVEDHEPKWNASVHELQGGAVLETPTNPCCSEVVYVHMQEHARACVQSHLAKRASWNNLGDGDSCLVLYCNSFAFSCFFF